MAQILIDGEKFRKCLFDAGVKPSQASKEIGFSQAYFSQAIQRGSMSEVAANALYATYGISPDAYREEEEEAASAAGAEWTALATVTPLRPAQAARKPGGPVMIDPDALREAVREGILDAAVQIAADKGLAEALGRVIYGAVNGAIVNADRIREMNFTGRRQG